MEIGAYVRHFEHMCDQNVMVPGTLARLVCEWPNLALGDTVTVVRYDPVQGYLVNANSHLDELWLPAHVLSSQNRKPWSFRFRKPSFTTHGRRSIEGTAFQETISEVTCPEFLNKIKNITSQQGAKIVFKCRVKNCGGNTKISWRKTEPDPCVIRTSGRFIVNRDEGFASLAINNCKISDSGSYLCTVSNEVGSTQCTAVLTITDSLPPLNEPTIEVLSCSSVMLKWDSYNYDQFLIEYCKLGSGEWLSPNNHQLIHTFLYCIEHLTPGETYSFRIIAAQNKLVGLPSVAVTLPVADNIRWQQEQFKRRYFEMDEIGRGRFSVVRKAKDRGTGQEVALKQVLRRKQGHKVTQAEYALLASMQHLNIIHAMALFDNAPVPGVDTIVLEMVKGPLLFNHICHGSEYSEEEVRDYSRQVMFAVGWLHKRDLAHLDIKPENVMVDLTSSAPIVKLIDFGDCVNTYKNVILPPACLEFASPELVLGKPVGKHTDLWAVGVFLYVLLSGVSPFLDDSVEETTANILKCDFCFPDEYFCDISQDVKELIRRLLVLAPMQRFSIDECLNSVWFNQELSNTRINSTNLQTFMQRRNPIILQSTPKTAYFTD